MCGIVSVLLKDRAVDYKQLERAIESLHTRGPDGRAIWISANRNIGLAHCRLSMVGKENGAQPIWNEDRTIGSVVNGEFYEFETIRKDLEKRCHHFRL